MVQRADDHSPLRALCSDVQKYRSSYDAIAPKVKDLNSLWHTPIKPVLMMALIRWVELDVLEDRGADADQLRVLRAEALCAYAKSEREPKGAIWAERFLDAISPEGRKMLSSRIREIRERLS